MIDKIKNWLFKPDELEGADTPLTQSANFKLCLKNNEIGFLNLENGQWYFEYSQWFKDQDGISVLIDFPDKSQRYTSSQLWPFFVSRIPGLKQPTIETIIEREKINRQDLSALLKRFGIYAIQNPYRLYVQ